MWEKIGEGRTAEVLTAWSNRVVKLYRPEFAHLAEMEAAAARVVDASDIPAPYFYGKTERNGRTGLIFEFAIGDNMLWALRDNPMGIRGHARRMASLHHDIHAAAVGDALPSVHEQLWDAIMRAPALSQPERDAAIAHLDTLPQGDRICHMDFHPENILISGRYAVAVDWVTAAKGDPLADVCRTCLILESGGVPKDTHPFVARAMRSFGASMMRQYREFYLKKANASPTDVDQWRLPMAAARLAEGIESETRWLLEIVRSAMRGEVEKIW